MSPEGAVDSNTGNLWMKKDIHMNINEVQSDQNLQIINKTSTNAAALAQISLENCIFQAGPTFLFIRRDFFNVMIYLWFSKL